MPPIKSMTEDQWKALVQMWSDPKHKERCDKAKENRGKVKFPHKIGSRCYIAQTHVVAQMEAIMAEPTQEGQAPKTPV